MKKILSFALCLIALSNFKAYAFPKSLDPCQMGVVLDNITGYRFLDTTSDNHNAAFWLQGEPEYPSAFKTVIAPMLTILNSENGLTANYYRGFHTFILTKNPITNDEGQYIYFPQMLLGEITDSAYFEHGLDITLHGAKIYIDDHLTIYPVEKFTCSESEAKRLLAFNNDYNGIFLRPFAYNPSTKQKTVRYQIFSDHTQKPVVENKTYQFITFSY